MDFPDGSVLEEFADNAGDASLTPGSWRSPREGNVNPLQYSCLGNPMDRGAWWATVHGIAKELDTATRQQQWGIYFSSFLNNIILIRKNHLYFSKILGKHWVKDSML